MTLALHDQEEYSLGSLTVKALHTPCHTRGHVLFYVTSAAAAEEAPSDGERREGLAPLVFSGDTLFVGGCGRFFEGDASQSKPNTTHIENEHGAYGVWVYLFLLGLRHVTFMSLDLRQPHFLRNRQAKQNGNMEWTVLADPDVHLL